MNRYKFCYQIALLGLLLLTACQSDDKSEPGVGLQPDGKIRVHLKVGAAGSETTRAWSDSQYANDLEMMNVWTVVVVDNATNKVVSIYACKPDGNPDQEIDDIAELPAVGTYRFYSFANMSPSVVKKLLSIDGTAVVDPGSVRTRGEGDGNGNNDPTTGPSTGGEEIKVTAYNGVGSAVDPDLVTSYQSANAPDPFMTDDNKYAKNTYYPIDVEEGALVTAAAVSAATVNMPGNNFPVTGANGYGAVGIPMSNVQTKTVDASTTSIELIVIRMMAKIELDVYNDGENDATISSISLTDITKNANNNLKLLPNLTAGANSMNYTHKDIQPNLGAAASTGNMTLSPTTASQGLIAKTGHRTTDNPRNPVKFIFYVNESDAPDNGSGLFYVTLGIKTGSGTDVVYSHALISDTDAKEWGYIARNDYRQIPIVLTDWVFRIEPLAFVPIAGYPATMLSSDAQSATFGTGGIIALQPFVKKRTGAFWLDFSDPDVTFVDIHWKNSDGTDVSGAGKIVKTAFSYDDTNKCIIGEMNQAKVSTSHDTKTAITVTVKLGPSGSQFTYSFTCDVNI